MEQRSASRRGSSAKPVPPYRNKRFLMIMAAVLTFGAFVTVAQVSNAADRRRPRPPVACPPASSQAQQPAPNESASDVADVTTQNGRQVRNYRDDGSANTGRRWNRPPANCTPASGGATPTSTSSSAPALDVLGTNCENSRLERHDGFQNGARCVQVSHGEVPTEANSPSLLITAVIVNGQRFRPGAQPITINRNTPFEIEVSTRNLVRDRFLRAAAGGYYAEASFLTAEGLVRGHFHTSCRNLPNNNEAPDASPVPAFFVATEDGGGGDEPDRIRVAVTGIANAGQVQCSSWAGDGGHRTPMMPRANMQPAFDSLRVFVR